MAKSKSKRTPINASAKPGLSGRRKFDLIAIGVVAAGAIAWGVSAWLGSQDQDRFEDLARAGGGLLETVESPPFEGTGHQGPYSYRGNPPTSGAHHPEPLNPGFYSTPQPPTRLVHSLEHGHIVIYYDETDPTVLSTLKVWTSLFNHPWGGVLATPKVELGKSVILTAWRKKLTLATFDEATAAAFIDRYRGRGPENPIR